MFFRDYVYPIELPSRVEMLIKKLEDNRMLFNTPPNYFCLRASEFQHVVNIGIFNDNLSTILEMGCGNGFISALLSEYANIVIGIDIGKRNSLTHSLGLELPNRLISFLNISNVEIREGRAEKIPLGNNSVDIVYSHYVFDHIINLGPALREIKRVLVKSGKIVTVVPNFRNRINWAFRYIFKGGIVKNYLRPIYRLLFKGCNLKESFSDSFLFIPPHDRRFSFLQECINYRLNAWKAKFIQNKYSIERIIPIRPDSIALIARPE